MSWCKRLPAPVQSGLPPPAARDWLTTHLLHAACPLLYCVSIINNNLARLNGMTVINACQLKFVKGVFVWEGDYVYQVWGYYLIGVDSWRPSVCSGQAAVLLLDEIWRRRGVESEKAISQVALTDLFSRTFPAESHLSKMLPAVRGLETPDKTTQDTASS